MLKVEKVSVAYGRVTAVREVSLIVNDREIVTLIGSNGAGKTTLLNAITGVVPEDRRHLAGRPTGSLDSLLTER